MRGQDKLLFLFTLAFLILALPSFAADIDYSQPGADPGTVMKGISFTVTVSGLSGSGIVTLNLPSGFSVDESLSKSYSTGTTSVSWTTVKAEQKLSAQKLSATITTQSTSETVYTDVFDVILPPSLDATLSPSSISLIAGSYVTLSVNVKNWGETTARSVIVTISLPSSCSLASGYSSSVSLGDIAGGEAGSGEAKATSFRFTCSASGSGSITVTSSNANSVVKSFSISVTQPTTTTYVTPGYPTNLTEIRRARLWTFVVAGVLNTMSIDDERIAIRNLSFSLNTNRSNVRIAVSRLLTKPAGLPDPAGMQVYQYFNITAENVEDEDIAGANLTFEVSKSWLEENNIDKNSIRLLRFHDNAWEELETILLYEDNETITYLAFLPGFSYFAIAGVPITATTTTITTTTTTLPQTTTTTLLTTTTTLPVTTTTMPVTPQVSYPSIAIVVLAIIIVLAILFVKEKSLRTFTKRKRK